ncbi:MAG: hypothetical protein BGO31_12075 [Bacteroidetes bacterium 43-16]|nr:MAG: hypothetical protein BGO31_12075 [Bacteroidetes bacterium 43-16]
MRHPHPGITISYRTLSKAHALITKVPQLLHVKKEQPISFLFFHQATDKALMPLCINIKAIASRLGSNANRQI